MRMRVKRRVLFSVVMVLAVVAPAMTYAAYSSRLPSDDAAGAPIALPATSADRLGNVRVSEEAAMVMAGVALLGAAAVVRRAA